MAPKISRYYSLVLLLLLGLALAWSVLFRAGVWPADWQPTLLIVGLVSSFYWLTAYRGARAPALKKYMRVSLLLLFADLILQLIPLPPFLLGILSPARAGLLHDLTSAGIQVTTAPLTVAPALSLLYLFSFAGYLLVFLIVRELCWRSSTGCWPMAIPLIVIASLESLLGIIQNIRGSPGSNVTGTYTNRDHFSSFLEMILPLALVYGLVLFRRGREDGGLSLRGALAVAVVWGLATAMFVAIVYSLSRTGFLVAVIALLFIFLLCIETRGRAVSKPARIGTLLLLLLAMLIFLPTNTLLNRFAGMTAPAEAASDARFPIWKETLPLIMKFPVFGCGLGGYESAFLRYQKTNNNFGVQFAHNDYLQYLAELGIVGFLLLAVCGVSIVSETTRAVLNSENSEKRLLAVACAGSILAIALHSAVEFDTYIPANAMTLGWIAGIASALGAGLPRQPSRPDRAVNTPLHG
jgi:O-antigen ligase